MREQVRGDRGRAGRHEFAAMRDPALDPVALLDEIVRRICSVWAAEKTVLFRSRATETANPESDYDLLVVLPDGSNPRTSLAAIQASLAGLGVAKDLIVVPANRFQRYRGVVNTVYWHASTAGRTLYDCAA